MKTIREIVTELNVVRSNNCDKEKSEEIKSIINDLLPYAEAFEIMNSKNVSIGYIKRVSFFMYNNAHTLNERLHITEYDLLKEIFK